MNIKLTAAAILFTALIQTTGSAQSQGEFHLVETVLIEDVQLSASLELEVIEEGFLILDKQQKKIFYLTERGELLQSIGGEGRGPGEMEDPTSFLYHEGNIIVSDRSLSRVTVFDLEGELIHTFQSSPHAIDMAVIGDLLFLYNPFHLAGDIVSSYRIPTGTPVQEFRDVSEVQVRLKAGLMNTLFQGIEKIGNQLFVLSHPYELIVGIYNPDGELLNEYDPITDIYIPPEVPENFNPFTAPDRFSDYVKSSVLRFYAHDGQLYLIQSHFESGDKFLDIYDMDMNRLTSESMNIGDLRPHTVGDDGYFYMLSEMQPGENGSDYGVGIQKFELVWN